MTAEELEKMIQKHESQNFEMKESFCAECIETACAFANARGGIIVIGIDNHGHLSKHELRLEALRDYENKIATATEPMVIVDAEKVPFAERDVIVLRIQENPLKPVAVRGRSFIRKGSVNHQMTPFEIAECHLKSTGASMDVVIVPEATKNDLDLAKVRRYMEVSTSVGRRAYQPTDDPWEVLLKLELAKSETAITRAAYLLFAKDPQRKFPQAIVHAGAFKADGVEIIDSHDAKGNVQDQVAETLTFIKRNIRCALKVTDRDKHDVVWDYPTEAIRETVANAICHRDYGSQHDIQVKVYDDSVWIANPGRLPFDMPMELLMNPKHPSRPRNKIIAQAFFDMGIIEQYGGGIERIKNECDKTGTPYPTWTDKYESFITEYHKRDNAPLNGDAPLNAPLNGNMPLKGRILELVKAAPGIKRHELADLLKVVEKYGLSCTFRLEK